MTEMTPTFGSVMDQYNAAKDIADSVGWDVVMDVTPGVDDWVRLLDAAATVANLHKQIEALEKERVAYLKALCQEDSYVIERVTRRVINMRDETTPELAEGLAALAAKEPKP